MLNEVSFFFNCEFYCCQIGFRTFGRIQLMKKVRIWSDLNHSTVTDCFKTNSPNSKSGEFRILKQFNISFKLVVKSSSLTSLHHYNNKQQQLYDEIKHLKEVKGFGYRRISQILCEKGFTTVRSNKPILNNYVHSIYRRGKTREERINRGYESSIQDMMCSMIFW